MTEYFREKVVKRRLLKLMQREKHLSWRIEKMRTVGKDTGRAAAECIALRWALEELARIYPSDATEARRDIERYWSPPAIPHLTDEESQHGGQG